MKKRIHKATWTLHTFHYIDNKHYRDESTKTIHTTTLGSGENFSVALDQQGAKNFAWKMSRYVYRKRCRRKLRTGKVVLGCKIGTTKTNCGRMGNYSFQITPESKIQEITTLQYKNY